jgi:uncharacterized membrane protein
MNTAMPAEAACISPDAQADPLQPLASWNLTRNCAMSPGGFMLHVAAASALSCLIGLGFWAAGYPLVLAFCLCQSLALAAAALAHAVHAVDGERIVLTAQTLEVHATRGLRARTFRLDPSWTRLEGAAGPGAPALRSGSTRVPVAVYLTAAERRHFAAEFNRTLAHRKELFHVRHP